MIDRYLLTLALPLAALALLRHPRRRGPALAGETDQRVGEDPMRVLGVGDDLVALLTGEDKISPENDVTILVESETLLEIVCGVLQRNLQLIRIGEVLRANADERAACRGTDQASAEARVQAQRIIYS